MKDPASGISGPQPQKPFSELLQEIGADERIERVSVALLLEAMSARAFGAMLLIFALPNTIPNIPGTSAILAIPLLYLSGQMLTGRPPHLPQAIAGRSVAREDFTRVVARLTPALARAERLLRPRLNAMVSPMAQRLIGALCMILSIVLILPVPFGNMLPAFALSVIALGLLERDGLWVLSGVIVAILSLVIVSGVIWALIRTAAFVLANVLA